MNELSKVIYLAGEWQTLEDNPLSSLSTTFAYGHLCTNMCVRTYNKYLHGHAHICLQLENGTFMLYAY